MVALTDRWFPLDYHEGQAALWESTARFRVAPAGRRSGKTEVAKRYLILQAITFALAAGRFAFAAPTYQQAREIFWEDLLDLLPPWAVRKVDHTRLHVWLVNGAKIMVVGLDKPQRVEGKHLDGIVIDEIADCRPDAWPRHVRPMLSTAGRAPGWAWFIGVPEGFNHFWDLWERSQDAAEEDWFGVTWPSDGILDPVELLAAMRELDADEYAQEYRAVFRSREGRAYHQFDRRVHARGRIKYDADLDLHLCFDFGNAPGVLAVAQLREPPLWLEGAKPAAPVPCFVDEVFIDSGSTTYAVCDAFLDRYEDHPGQVFLYGDSSGGQKGSSAVKGSDWDLVYEKLLPHFGDCLTKRVPRRNPFQRPRLNAFNKMCRNAAGEVRLAVDKRCRKLIVSLENTQVDEEGEIIKPKGEKISHLGDASSYFVVNRWPVKGRDKLRQKGYAA